MVLSTPDGWSVPEDTDPLANVADWITDLALDLSPRAVGLSRTTAFSIPNAAYTSVPMTVEDTDVHGQAALAAGVYTLTLSEAGLYRVSGTLGILGSAAGNGRGAQLEAGGVAFASSLIPPVAGAPSAVLSLSGLLKVTLATVVTLRAFQNSGAALNTTSYGAAHASIYAHRIAKAF